MSPDSLAFAFSPQGLVASAGVPLADRGFRYGMSVFESIAIFDGRPLFLDSHIGRLHSACHAAQFPIPACSWERLGALLETTLPASSRGMLRIYVTAGEGSPSAPATLPGVYCIFEETFFPDAAAIAAGYSVELSSVVFPCILGGWKTGNYWPNIQAMAEARHAGRDEILLFNAQGALVSASMANVFLLLDGRLCTPALGTGARHGVLRHWVSLQMPAEDALLSVDDLERAEECFLTNSRLGIMPVSLLGSRVLPSRSVSGQLSRLYRESILGC